MIDRIFISYRRDDSAGHAGRVFDRLKAEFGQDVLYMDVDAIPLGANFVKVLRDEVARCSVLLAIIGPRWLDAMDEDGARRLDYANDFVRVEIAAALARDIPVIPILLEGAKIPRAEELPPDLQELSQRNGLDVRHSSFHRDVDKLVRGLKAHGRTPADTEELPKPAAITPRQNEPAKTPTLPDGTVGIGGTTYVAIADRRLFPDAPVTARSTPSIANTDTKLGSYIQARRTAVPSVDEVLADAGQWHMLLGHAAVFSKLAPPMFDHLFVYVWNDWNVSAALGPGGIVTGKAWYGTTVPDWKVLHGQLNSSDETVSIPVGYLTYLGPIWRAEFAELSEAVFYKRGGKPLARFIRHA